MVEVPGALAKEIKFGLVDATRSAANVFVPVMIAGIYFCMLVVQRITYFPSFHVNKIAVPFAVYAIASARAGKKYQEK